MIPAVNPTRPEDKDYFLKRGLDLAKSFGYTTAYEGRAFAFQHEQLLDAARRGLLDIDVVSQIDYADRRVIPSPVTTGYDNRYRVAGLKITLDGSAPGRTAWLTKPYLIPARGAEARIHGLPCDSGHQGRVGPDRRGLPEGLASAHPRQSGRSRLRRSELRSAKACRSTATPMRPWPCPT
jgi:hypothetical protein